MNIKLIVSFAVLVVFVGAWFVFSDRGWKMEGWSMDDIGGSTKSVNEINTNKKAGIKKVNTFSNISPKDLYDLLGKKERDFVLINVHTPYMGEIAGTDKFIAYNNILANLDKIPADKNTKIILYCQSGGMSAIASQTLVNLGYVNIENLFGGMIDWKKDGYPLKYDSSREVVR